MTDYRIWCSIHKTYINMASTHSHQRLVPSYAHQKIQKCKNIDDTSNVINWTEFVFLFQNC